MDQDCGDSSTEVFCIGCENNISHMDLNTRTAHVERCLGLTTTTITHKSDQGRQLDRLKDCPVCGFEWSSLDTPRLIHVQECANKHSLTLKQLNDLIDMFCESLNGGQQYSSKKDKTKASSFLKSFGGHRDKDDSDDFQPTQRRRTPMVQTQIRVSKKQQAVIDEFDDDLNEAKGLSLSLKRVAPGGSSLPSSTKRSRGRANELSKSDILACEEAQNLIKQRAMEFKYQNEEKLSLLRLQQQQGRRRQIENTIYLWNVGSLSEDSPLLSKSCCYYCPILAKYLSV